MRQGVALKRTWQGDDRHGLIVATTHDFAAIDLSDTDPCNDVSRIVVDFGLSFEIVVVVS